MLTKENINPCNNQLYQYSGAVGTTLTYHNNYDTLHSGAIGTTDVWYEGSKGAITYNLSMEGSANDYSLALFKIDNGGGKTLLFNSQNQQNTSFIVNNLDNIEEHKQCHLYITCSYGDTIKASFMILNVFESGVHRVSFNRILRGISDTGNKYFIQLYNLQVERIRNFDNLYSTIANKANITVTARDSNIGLGFFDGIRGSERVTQRRIVVNLVNGDTVEQQLLNKTFGSTEDNYEVISFTTPSEISSSHYLRIFTRKTPYGSTSTITVIDIQIPIHDGDNALLCPDCTYYLCFNHRKASVEEETIDSLSISRYPFTKDLWQSIIEPIVIKEDSQYLSAYNDIFTGTTGSTSGISTQACIFKENIAGETGNNGCDIYLYQRSTGSSTLLQTYIRVKPVATQTYVIGQAIRACDLLNEASWYTITPIQ